MYYKHIASLLLILIVSGCGQKGPLYLPDEPAPIHVEDEEEEQK